MGKEWRKRKTGTPRQVGQAFVLEPHGDKRNLPHGGLTVVTPCIARKLHLEKVAVEKIPKTVYHDKKDNDRVKYFMDLIQRGIVPPPAEIHRRPDGTWEILDGKHRIEAYRRLGYKKIPVVTNATVGEIADALGKSYEDMLFEQPRGFSEKKDLAMRAISAQRGNPLVNEDNPAAFDTLNPLSSGETQTEEIVADRRRRVVKSGDLVTGKRRGEEWRTRTTGTESQVGQHYVMEPHGDKAALPKGLTVVTPVKELPPSVPMPKSGFGVQYVDEDIRDKEGYKYMAMNYKEAAELGIYFPYSEETILISKKLNSEERAQVLEIQVREIAKMKKGMSYLEAHAQVMKEMPEKVPKVKGFWDSAKGLAISAMERYKANIKADTAQRNKDRLFSEISTMGMEDGVRAADKELPLIEAKKYGEDATMKVKTKGKRQEPEIEVREK